MSEHFAFAIGKSSEGVLLAADERGYDLRVQRRATAGDSFGGLEELQT